MTIDLRAASRFMTTHGRLLDRRRFALLVGDATWEAVLDALAPYRNPDGGYGWGLEADLRAPESQPGAALHAFEVLEDIAPHTSPRSVELCEWLLSASLPDGGLPFALPIADAEGTAPFWAGADPRASSLQITAAVSAAAHRVAQHDPSVALHPWLRMATRFCLGEIARLDSSAHAYELLFAFHLLDAVHEHEADAPGLLERLTGLIPANGALHVAGGADDEYVRPLDYAPLPDRPIRRHLPQGVIDGDLDALAARQGEHGGWEPDWVCYSPAARLEWSGHLTVRAVRVLRVNGRLD